jgi:hypothetical protein
MECNTSMTRFSAIEFIRSINCVNQSELISRWICRIRCRRSFGGDDRPRQRWIIKKKTESNRICGSTFSFKSVNGSGLPQYFSKTVSRVNTGPRRKLFKSGRQLECCKGNLDKYNELHSYPPLTLLKSGNRIINYDSFSIFFLHRKNPEPVVFLMLSS